MSSQKRYKARRSSPKEKTERSQCGQATSKVGRAIHGEGRRKTRLFLLDRHRGDNNYPHKEHQQFEKVLHMIVTAVFATV